VAAPGNNVIGKKHHVASAPCFPLNIGDASDQRDISIGLARMGARMGRIFARSQDPLEP
jgi:hypothetical protein